MHTHTYVFILVDYLSCDFHEVIFSSELLSYQTNFGQILCGIQQKELLFYLKVDD